jgi:hypothetical protein
MQHSKPNQNSLCCTNVLTDSVSGAVSSSAVSGVFAHSGVFLDLLIQEIIGTQVFSKFSVILVW